MNKEEAIKIINSYGYNVDEELSSKVDVRNQKIKLIDKYGYRYYLSIGDLKDCRCASHQIVKKFNPFSIDNIQQYIYNNGGNAKVLSKKWNCDKKIKLKCEKCGKIFYESWYHIFETKKFKCNSCTNKNRTYNENKKNDTIKLCKKHGYDIIEGTYRSRHKFDMIDNQGYKYYNCSVANLDSRSNKFARFNYKNIYQIENVFLYIKLNSLPIKFVNDNLKNFKKNDYLDVICCECGRQYKATWGELIYNRDVSTNRFRCEFCNKRESNLEYTIENYLKLKKIKYEKQKRFDWCRIKRNLPFDFYLNDYKALIEINGSQHYYKNKIFQQSLIERRKVDSFKKECAIKNGYNFVEIPYWLITQSNIDTYKTIIDNIVS
jgi:very-short-patch-repair endonuclease